MRINPVPGVELLLLVVLIWIIRIWSTLTCKIREKQKHLKLYECEKISLSFSASPGSITALLKFSPETTSALITSCYHFSPVIKTYYFIFPLNFHTKLFDNMNCLHVLPQNGNSMLMGTIGNICSITDFLLVIFFHFLLTSHDFCPLWILRYSLKLNPSFDWCKHMKVNWSIWPKPFLYYYIWVLFFSSLASWTIIRFDSLDWIGLDWVGTWTLRKQKIP